MSSIGFVYSETFLQHKTPDGHPERPDRLSTLVTHLRQIGRWETLRHIDPRRATEEEVLAVHSAQYLTHLSEVCVRGGGLLDEGDTYASTQSCDAAIRAAGAVLEAVDAVLGGTTDTAFCAVRPPGHHAEHSRAMGFCLLNNIAIAARYAQEKHRREKIAIVDWDVHHGNGTQHIFEDDPTVFYISLHQYPLYPGTGAKEERGRGKGVGFTLNFPLPAGTEEDRYLKIFTNEISPALREFKPDLLLLSAGFDAHRDDPLAGMKLTESSYGKMTDAIKDVAPIVSVLEGGYNVMALARSVEVHLSALERL